MYVCYIPSSKPQNSIPKDEYYYRKFADSCSCTSILVCFQ